jgi:hypothetical protein
VTTVKSVDVYPVAERPCPTEPLMRHVTNYQAGFAGIVSVPRHSAVAVATEDGVIRIYRWPSRALVGELDTGERIRALAASPGGDLLAVVHGSGRGYARGASLSLWQLFPRLFFDPLADAVPSQIAQVEAAVADPRFQAYRPSLEALAAVLGHRLRRETHVGDPAGTRAARPDGIEVGGP